MSDQYIVVINKNSETKRIKAVNLELAKKFVHDAIKQGYNAHYNKA
jgi:hypothetical protein